MIQSDKPKLVYILPEYDPATGSHFFHLYEFLKVIAMDFDLFLVIEKAKTFSPDLPPPFYVQKFSFLPWRFLELLFSLAGARSRGYRHFYTHYSFLGGLASWLVARFSGGRAYYWNCGLPWLYCRGFFKEAVFRFILRHTLLVTGTEGLKRSYVWHYRLGKENVHVLPNWINLSRFQPGRDEVGAADGVRNLRDRWNIAPGTKVMLFLHRLSRRKGAHLLPEIIAEVTKHDKNVILVIAGRGPERKNLELRIKNHELEGYVQIVGEVPNREVQNYFKAADIFIMPSEEEGFPHVLLEAQALGVPYVASDVGGVREMTPPALYHFLAPSHDIPAFSEKIVELLSKDSLERLRLSQITTEWVKQYDIGEASKKFRGLFS